MSVSVDSLVRGFNLSVRYPVVFLPALAPLVLDGLFRLRVYRLWVWGFPFMFTVGFEWVVQVLASLTVSVVGFVAGCMEVDMAYDAVRGRAPSLSKSFSFTLSRLGDLVVAALISTVLSFTVILTPMAFFLVVSVVVDSVDPVEAARRAFSFVLGNLGEVLVFILAVIVVYGVCMVVPLVGGLLLWASSVIVTVSSVVLYLRIR